MRKHIEVTNLSQYEALAECEGCFAKWYSQSEAAFVRALGLREEPVARDGYWAACERDIARNELEAGRPVQWWPADYTDTAKRDACYDAAAQAVG